MHKVMCRSFKDFIDRPTPGSRRAILFPANESRPKFIWLNKIEHCEEVDVGPLLQGTDAKPSYRRVFPQHIPVQRSTQLNRDLHHTIILAVREKFIVDGSIQNMSIVRITDGANSHDWRGPMIAYGMKGLVMEQTYTDDLDTFDFKMAVDYLRVYLYEGITSQPSRRAGMVQGVIVHCDADVETCGNPRYEAVDVPTTDAIFRHGAQRSQIADRVGLPLLARKMLPKQQWKDQRVNGTMLPCYCTRRSKPMMKRLGLLVRAGQRITGRTIPEMRYSCARIKSRWRFGTWYLCACGTDMF